METTDAPDRLLIQFSDGRFAFCPVSGGKIGTLASCPLPHGEEQADALRSLLRQKALQCPEGGATVLYDNDRVCLIPAEYYREEDAERYMTLSGIPGEAERRTVATAPRDGKIALISIARTVYDCLHSAYGDRLAYTHPLLESAVRHARKPLLAAALTRSFVHLSAYDGGLLFAETLPRHSDADLLYYLGALTKIYAGTNFRIEISGTDAPQLRRAAARYFRRTRLFRPSVNRSVAGSENVCDFTHLIRLNHENH